MRQLKWGSTPKYVEFKLGRFSTKLSYRSGNSFMGRFGGGWNWKLGFQIGGPTIVISLLIVEWTLSMYKKKFS